MNRGESIWDASLFGIIEQYFGCLAFQSGGDANLLPICPYFPNDDDPGPGHSILWIIWVSAEITIINYHPKILLKMDFLGGMGSGRSMSMSPSMMACGILVTMDSAKS